MSIQEIANKWDVLMIHRDGIVLVVAGDTHWFSATEDVEEADREGTEAGDDQEVFFEECASIPEIDLRRKYHHAVHWILDDLLERYPDTYDKLGVSHDGIVSAAMM